MPNEELLRILRSLITQETIVKQLIGVKWSTWPIVESKLCMMENLVVDIPEEYEEMAIEWRERLAKLWIQFAAKQASQCAACQEQSLSALDSLMHSNSSNNNSNPTKCYPLVDNAAQSSAINALNQQSASDDSQLAQLFMNVEKLNSLWKQCGEQANGGPKNTLVESNSPQTSTIASDSHVSTSYYGNRKSAQETMCSPSNQSQPQSQQQAAAVAVGNLDPESVSLKNGKMSANWRRSPLQTAPESGEAIISRTTATFFPSIETAPNLKSSNWRQISSFDAENDAQSSCSNQSGSATKAVGAPESSSGDRDTAINSLSTGAENFAENSALVFASGETVATPSGRLSKNFIRTRLRNAFESIPKVGSIEIDFDGCNRLLDVLRQADQLIQPFWKDNQLQADILGCAFRKMPSEYLQNFLNHHRADAPKTIRDLKVFFADELSRCKNLSGEDHDDQDHNRNCENNNSRLASLPPPPPPPSPSSSAAIFIAKNENANGQESLKFCRNCKNVGHETEDCGKQSKTFFAYNKE